ncbi:MAG: hypothetical protein J7L91_01295 [Candidatus Korarchaeota archaeon]|nr:hypothetical protein [Candidatus Korarchaeota archaeon]
MQVRFRGKGRILVTVPNGSKLYVRIYQPRTRLYKGKFPAVICVAGGRGEGITGGAWSMGRP